MSATAPPRLAPVWLRAAAFLAAGAAHAAVLFGAPVAPPLHVAAPPLQIAIMASGGSAARRVDQTDTSDANEPETVAALPPQAMEATATTALEPVRPQEAPAEGGRETDEAPAPPARLVETQDDADPPAPPETPAMAPAPNAEVRQAPSAAATLSRPARSAGPSTSEPARRRSRPADPPAATLRRPRAERPARARGEPTLTGAATPRSPLPARSGEAARRQGGGGDSSPAATPSRGAASPMASGAYAARLHGLLQARANALGLEDVSGSVGVSFTVSREGRLTGSIVRPSGNFEIDSALRSMLREFSVPPPPGGGFSGAVTIRVR